MNIFDTADGGTISGVFGADNDEDSIVFSSVGSSDLDGFIINSYTVSWSRPVGYMRAYNKKGTIVQFGKGSGSLSLQGLVGPTEEFEALLQATSGTNVCKNANCTITVGGGYTACNTNGESTTSSDRLVITARGVTMQSISMGGSLQEGSINLTTANLTFKIAGLSID